MNTKQKSATGYWQLARVGTRKRATRHDASLVLAHHSSPITHHDLFRFQGRLATGCWQLARLATRDTRRETRVRIPTNPESRIPNHFFPSRLASRVSRLDIYFAMYWH
jgi:hypothetical protein